MVKRTGVRIFECPFPVTLITGSKFLKGRHRVPPGPDQDALKRARGVRDVTEKVLAEAEAIEAENARLRADLGVAPRPVERTPPPAPIPRQEAGSIDVHRPSVAGAEAVRRRGNNNPGNVDPASLPLGRRAGPAEVEPLPVHEGEPLPPGADDIGDVRPLREAANTDGDSTGKG